MAVFGWCWRISSSTFEVLQKNIPAFQKKFPACKNFSAVFPVRLFAEACNRNGSPLSPALRQPGTRYIRNRFRPIEAECPAPPRPAFRQPLYAALTNFRKRGSWVIKWSAGRKRPMVALASTPESTCAANAMQGAVFCCDGSAMICAFGTRGRLLPDFRLQVFIGDHPNVFRRDDALETVDGLLNQAAFTEETQHLLGIAFTAARPEAGTPSTGHNECITMIRHELHSVGSRALPLQTPARKAQCYGVGEPV